MFFIRNTFTLGAAFLLAVPLISHAQNNDWEGRWQSASADINQMREDAETSFDLLDHDNNNRITLDEIDLKFEDVPEDQQRAMRRRASVANQKFMRWNHEFDRFEVTDTNHDGVLDRDEFENEDANVRTHLLQLGLDELDEDKNGSINLREFTVHLDALEDLDQDGDGRLSREEFSKSKDSQLIMDAWRSSFRGFGRGSSTDVRVDIQHQGSSDRRVRYGVRAVESKPKSDENED